MSNPLSDIWTGITTGISNKISAAEQRIQTAQGTSSAAPTSGNTGAYLGMSIVDAISNYLHGNSQAITDKVVNSGTGQKLVSTATQQQIAKLVGDWRTWAIVIGFAFLFVLIGRHTGKR